MLGVGLGGVIALFQPKLPYDSIFLIWDVHKRRIYLRVISFTRIHLKE